MNATDGSVQGRGELVGPAGDCVLRFTRPLPAPPAHAWAAITDPDQLARWSFRGTMEPRAGGSLRFDFGEGGAADGTVLAWDPPAVLEYEWSAGPQESWRIRYELAEAADGATVLTFDHLRPDPARPEVAAGWHWHLDRLVDLLAGSQPAAVESDAHFEELLAAYQAERG